VANAHRSATTGASGSSCWCPAGQRRKERTFSRDTTNGAKIARAANKTFPETAGRDDGAVGSAPQPFGRNHAAIAAQAGFDFTLGHSPDHGGCLKKKPASTTPPEGGIEKAG